MWYNNRDIRVETMPVPEIGPGELLVRIEASGICGSDVMEWYRLDRAPLVLGHEIGGEVAEVGDGVENYQVGDRVCATHHVPCNTCHYCRSGHHTACDTLRQTKFYPGGLAEYVRLPAINVDRGVFRLPDSVSYEEATFIEPLACVLRAHRRAGIKPGNSVLVIGSGVAGLLQIALARALGAGTIVATDISQYRLEAASRFGASQTFHATEFTPDRLREVNSDRLADRVITCAGALSAIEQGLASLERGGTAMLFAPTDPDVTFPVSINDFFFRNDVTLTTSYAATQADHETALELIRVGAVPVQKMISHRFGLDGTQEGFRLVAEGKESIKVVIEPTK